jgi:hypothetical protein
MKLHPFNDVVKQASLTMSKGAVIHQQFLCEHCGVKQTMEIADKFFKKGKCEECGKITDIKLKGCNYLARFDLTRPA